MEIKTFRLSLKLFNAVPKGISQEPAYKESLEYGFITDEFASYALPKISALDSFIQKNKHLPNIPSGAEMKENGLNLNTFAMQLLRKVEELTLYVIGQNQTIEAQQKRIEDLEKK